EVDDLDAGFEDVGLGVLIDQRRGGAVNRVTLFMRHITTTVHRSTGDVEDAAENALAHRHGDGRAGIGHGHAALEAFGGRHGDGAGHAFAEVLLNLEGEQLGLVTDRELDGERLVDGRDAVHGELHVDDGADDLDDFAGIHYLRNGERGAGYVEVDQAAVNWAAAISRIS